MSTINERIAETKVKLQQLERQRIMQEKRDQDAKRKVDFRRQLIVGELFINHFPIALEFTPCRTASENRIEFAPLEEFISALAEHQDQLNKLEDDLILGSYK